MVVMEKFYDDLMIINLYIVSVFCSAPGRQPHNEFVFLETVQLFIICTTQIATSIKEYVIM